MANLALTWKSHTSLFAEQGIYELFVSQEQWFIYCNVPNSVKKVIGQGVGSSLSSNINAAEECLANFLRDTSS